MDIWKKFDATLVILRRVDMLDYQNSVEQMTHQQNNMISYHPQHHHQQIPQNPDNYFTYPDSMSNGRQTFALNPAPLAALHSMADMKPSQPTSSSADAAAVANYNSAAYYSMKHCLNAAAATPHGITDILSRPDLQAQLQARLGQGVYYNNSCSQASSGAMPLNHNSKDTASAAVTANRSLYHWPNNGQMLSSGQAPAWHSKNGELLNG